jgi:demethylmenaquinone methyltransferase/2-methoxy-6-polyprenyl-1,4-benzoquinol methylase
MTTMTMQPVVRQRAYAEDARRYDQRTRAFQHFRRLIVDALPVRRGEVVLDVGCGTGMCFGLLREKVGASGTVIGTDASAEMVAVARERVHREGWANVEVIESPISEARIPVRADGALLCAVHDIMQSPEALAAVLDSLRPGAPVAAGGGKYTSPWMVALNLQVQTLHAPYVADFTGFDRPWRHLERFVDGLHVREIAFGTGYVATGRAPAFAM